MIIYFLGFPDIVKELKVMNKKFVYFKEYRCVYDYYIRYKNFGIGIYMVWPGAEFSPDQFGARPSQGVIFADYRTTYQTSHQSKFVMLWLDYNDLGKQK